MDVVEAVGILLESITSGLKNFVDFVIQLPKFFYNILNCIPNPLSGILNFFLTIFLFLVITYAIARLWSIVKGG